MKRKTMLLTLVLAFAMALCFVACGGDEPAPKSDYEFEGVNDVHIASTVTEYDFTKNVVGFKDLKEVEFTVDSSGVTFGTPGKYTVYYKIDDYKCESSVYVYGEPEFTSQSATISYTDAQTDSGLKKGLGAKDTFGNDLEISVTQGISADDTLGYLTYGSYEVKYSATDRVGNKATYTRTVTVSEEGKPVFADIEVDLADIEKAVLLDGQNVLKIYMQSGNDFTELTSDEYSFASGYLSFKQGFILAREGNTTLRIVTDKGYNSANLIVTDNQPAKFNFAVRDAAYASTLTLPKAEMIGHQKGITFTYELKDSQNQAVELTDNGTDFSFALGVDEQLFTFTAKAWRNDGQDAAGEKSVQFKVHDNLLATTVSPDGEGVNYIIENPDEYKVTYSTEYKHGTDVGSVYVENLNTNDAGAGVLLLRLRDLVASVNGDSALSLWVYSKTNVSVGADIYTTSGWWTNPAQGLAVPGLLAKAEPTTAQSGWHKLTLVYDPAFAADGGIGSMTTGEGYLVLRIYTIYEDDTKNWSWDTTQGHFGLYITNVYRDVNPSVYGINYGEASFVSTGIEQVEFTLPAATATDARIKFDYEVKKGEASVNIDNTTLTFLPQTAGDYTVTITAKLRGEEADKQTVNFTIAEDNLLIQTAQYYTYDNATGNVTLPEAHIPAKYSGKTVRYSVKLGAGAETVLGADRVFNTGKTNGDYTYKAEVLDTDGETVLETVQVTLKIHADNVLLGLGRDASVVTDALKVHSDVVFTYVTDEHAPGEVGATKVDAANVVGGTENGNFVLQLAHTDIKNMSTITFYVKYTSETKPLNISYYFFNGQHIQGTNFWYNNQHYTTWNAVVCGDWVKVEVILPDDIGTSNNGDIRIQLQADANTSDVSVLYISNIYGIPRA